MTRRFFWMTLGWIAVLGLGAGWAGYHRACDPLLHAAAERGDAEAWLRHEFRLTEQQMHRIRNLHRTYESECERHCAAINEARRALRDLERAGASTSALAAQRALIRERELVCEGAIAGHLRQVAALMPEEQGRRYLELLLPMIAKFDHQRAPDLRLNR